MRTVILGIALLSAVGLFVGGFTIISGSPFEPTVQVTDAEGSAVQATNSQLAQLGIVVLVVLGGIVANAALLAGVVWLLSREVERAVESEPNPFEFSLAPDGNSIGSIARRNPVPVVAALSLGLVVAFVALIVLTGAI